MHAHAEGFLGLYVGSCWLLLGLCWPSPPGGRVCMHMYMRASYNETFSLDLVSFFLRKMPDNASSTSELPGAWLAQPHTLPSQVRPPIVSSAMIALPGLALLVSDVSF